MTCKYCINLVHSQRFIMQIRSKSVISGHSKWYFTGKAQPLITTWEAENVKYIMFLTEESNTVHVLYDTLLDLLPVKTVTVALLSWDFLSMFMSSNDHMHLTDEKFTWHLTTVSCIHAVTTVHNILRTLSALSPQLTLPCSFCRVPCRIYLQAVPCDPAGADFNFAALSFNSKFLHQIHLIPLHPHSHRHSRPLRFRTERCCPRLEREKLWGGNESDPYHNFLSGWCAVIYDSLALSQPMLPPPFSRSLSVSSRNSLVYWCVLVWRASGVLSPLRQCCI